MSAAIQAIRTAGRSRRYDCGVTIFREGDIGGCAFIVDQGTVEIWTMRGEKRHTLALLQEGDLFGEMAVIDRIPRTASATARGETVLTVLAADQLVDRIASADPVVQLIVEMLLSRHRAKQRRAESPAQTAAGMTAIAKMRMESVLQSALARDDFQLFYQPIVDLKTRRTVAVEALLRWHHPVLGWINPQDIVTLAEETNLIVAIDQWVIGRAVRDLAALPLELSVAINLSGHEVGRTEIIEVLDALVAETGVSPGRIKLEVTEGVLVWAEAALPWIAACQERGYRVVLDDFGTGYSSLAYVLKLAVDTLKIDRSFVMDMATDPRAASIIEAILGMATTLEMAVVAEGVEDEALAGWLAERGCQMGQGYGFARPMTLTDLLAHLG